MSSYWCLQIDLHLRFIANNIWESRNIGVSLLYINGKVKLNNRIMKQTLRVIIVGLILGLVSQTTFAQYATETQQEMKTESPAPVSNGQFGVDIGRTFMFTGASIAMTGVVLGALSDIVSGGGDDLYGIALYSAIGCGVGGMVALAGLPFSLAGKLKMKRNGTSQMRISSEGQNGYVTNVALGFGLANTLSVDVVRGYNFNEHVFVGGGVGCSAYLYAEEGESYFDYVAIPVYADFRLTGGSKRVTPYMDTKVGCDVNGFDLYAGIEFGANIRSASGSHGDSWWIGVKSDCVDFEAQTIGLTVGKSF